jgi:hypothetical protein
VIERQSFIVINSIFTTTRKLYPDNVENPIHFTNLLARLLDGSKGEGFLDWMEHRKLPVLHH